MAKAYVVRHRRTVRQNADVVVVADSVEDAKAQLKECVEEDFKWYQDPDQVEDDDFNCKIFDIFEHERGILG